MLATLVVVAVIIALANGGSPVRMLQGIAGSVEVARRQRLEPKPVDADALVAGMADLVRRTMGPAIRLDLPLHDGRARVLCDPTELESALLNLCINARDAMPDGGRVTIT